MKKVFYIVGTRPQFMQASMLYLAIKKYLYKKIEFYLIHTGQHYNLEMNDIFFKELEIPEPYKNLEIGSALHNIQIGKMLLLLNDLYIKEKPDLVIVDGDTNSTLGGALAAVKLNIPVMHIESGLRSYIMQMPEEQNRTIVDHISSFLIAPTDTAYNNLKKENIKGKIYKIGDLLYDAFLYYKDHSLGRAENILHDLNIKSDFILFTLHRHENIHNKKRLKKILTQLNNINYIIIWPIHPHTKRIIREFSLQNYIEKDNIKIIPPSGYLEMLDLERRSFFIITDSGGIQREAYWHKKPMIILRSNTEWKEQLTTSLCYLYTNFNENLANKIDFMINNIKEDYKDFYGDGNSSLKVVKLIASL